MNTKTVKNEIAHDKSRPLNILITEDDMLGDDILAMSDFFSSYIAELDNSISDNTYVRAIKKMPIADLSIIGEVIDSAKVITTGDVQLVPDFKHLPKDVREKLRKGIYKVGESRQVKNNLRAVIVDKTGERVRDITLKKIRCNQDVLGNIRNLETQLQLKQIYAKLDDIQEAQQLQLELERNQDIKKPFNIAKSYILSAQDPSCNDADRMNNLNKAAEYLLQSETGAYLEIKTISDKLKNATKHPLFQRKSRINEYIKILSEDLQIVTRTTGLRLHILDYLSNKVDAKYELQKYIKEMHDFFDKTIEGRDYSIADLIHMNFKYDKDNRDFWHNLSGDFHKDIAVVDDKSINAAYMISVEDDDEQQ